MKVCIALFALLAVAAANPLPLVQIIVNVDASGKPIPEEAVNIQPPSVVLPIVDLPVEEVMVVNPEMPAPAPQPEIPELVIIPDPVVLPSPVLPSPVPSPEAMPDPVLPDTVVPGPVVLPDTLN